MQTGKHSVIYRANRMSDQCPVIIKQLKEDSFLIKSTAQLQHEYRMLQRIDSRRVIKAYELGDYKQCPYLVLEDFNGIELTEAIKNKLSLFEFLKIGIELAQGLGEIHHHNIIHKDIKPQNIIIHMPTLRIAFIDFGISTLLSRETQQIINQELLEGTVAYISPEQTGRMNRAMDYRTDIYSLGITLYQMIVGALPFQSNDVMELIHCHIAKEPPPPNKVDPQIPQAISDIILKCLAKNGEDRYCSAYGLKNDLENCLNQLNSTGTITPFIPALEDVYDHFQIPQKLYGREREIQTLLAAFERVANGSIEMLTVKGYAGIGKSSLVNEVQKAIVRKRGYFITGKYDQFQRNIPYYGVIQAFQSLAQQLIAESDQALALWKQKILFALGPNGRVITDVIPEMKLIIGEQPQVDRLDPQSTENRFKFVFSAFIEVFLKQEHPLIIFLDDLQWADDSSLKLIQFFMNSTTKGFLLFIGSYRDNEVDSSHSLVKTLNLIKEKGGNVDQLMIRPLEVESVYELIKDTLHDDSEDAMELAKIVQRKTEGNPFFIIQFLKTLYQEGMINFDVEKQRWTCRLDDIQQMKVTANVAEFMSLKIKALPQRTQDILKVGAAIGHNFELGLLSYVLGRRPLDVIDDLFPALQQEFVLSKQNIFSVEGYTNTFLDEKTAVTLAFQHDRVQQAAYQLIEEEEVNKLHLKIGQKLLEYTPEERRQEIIIDIVNQLNFGVSLIESDDDLVAYAKLNQAAGEKGKNSAAYKFAALYYLQAIQLLSRAGGWTKHYQQLFSLYENLAISELLLGNSKEANDAFDNVIEQAKTLHEKAEIYFLKIQLYGQMMQFEESLRCGKEALKLLGVSIQFPPSKGAILLEFLKVKWHLATTSIPSLYTAKEVKDQKVLLIGKIYTALLYTAYLVNAQITQLIVLKSANLALKYGLSENTTPTLAAFAAVLGSEAFQQYELAYELGTVAHEVAKRYPYSMNSFQTQMIYHVFINRWKVHIKESIEPLKEIEKKCFERGIVTYASTSLIHYLLFSLVKGDNIDVVNQEMLKNLPQMIKYKSAELLELRLLIEFCSSLKGSGNPYDLMPKDLVEILNSTTLQGEVFAAKFFYHVLKTIVLLVHDKPKEASLLAQVMKDYQDYFPNFVFWPLYYYCQALALADIYPSDNAKKSLRQLLKAQKRARKWASACPVNHLHKYLLISAEVARVRGKDLIAIELYGKAIAAAKENEYTFEEALGYERLAKFYLSRDQMDFAALFYQEAYKKYEKWGAAYKLILMRQKHPKLLSSLSKEVPVQSLTLTTTQSSHDFFDVNSIIQASQTISKEIVLSNLLKNLMNIVMVNAGADRVFFITQEEGSYFVQAEMFLGQNDPTLLQAIPLNEKSDELCEAIVQYVGRRREEILISNAQTEGSFTTNPYVLKHKPQSVLAFPLIHQGSLIAILYLENRLNKGAFTPERVKILSILSSQMAISLENAFFYAKLEQKVEERTRELKEAQKLLTQQEKMASLGVLTAGIAHEIRNPLNFIVNFSKLSQDIVAELGDFMASTEHSWKNDELAKVNDMLASLKSNTGIVFEEGKQADDILRAMLALSIGKPVSLEPTPVKVYFEKAIENAVQRMRGYAEDWVHIETSFDPTIETIELAPMEMNRVILNLIDNAFFTLSQKRKALGDGFIAKITVTTENAGKDYRIRIVDNGVGMSQEVLEKAINPFFTTKPTGQGVGLGLTLCQNIITQQHQGTLTLKSKEGEYTEVIITIPQ